MKFKTGDRVVSTYNDSPSYLHIGVIVDNAFAGYGYRVRFAEPLGSRYFGRDFGLVHLDEYCYSDFMDKIKDRMT